MMDITFLLEDFRNIVREMEDLYHKFDAATLKKALPYHVIENPPKVEYSLVPNNPAPKIVMDHILLGVMGFAAPILTQEDKMMVNFHIKADNAIEVLVALQQIAMSKYKQTRNASAALRARLGEKCFLPVVSIKGVSDTVWYFCRG
jgi:hypothetical protein